MIQMHSQLKMKMNMMMQMKVNPKRTMNMEGSVIQSGHFDRSSSEESSQFANPSQRSDLDKHFEPSSQENCGDEQE